jgi:hypothetical protein
MIDVRRYRLLGLLVKAFAFIDKFRFGMPRI